MSVRSGRPPAPGRLDPGGVAAAVGAMAAWAASGVIAKGVDMDGLAIVLYRMAMYSVLVVFVLLARGGRLTLATMRASAVAGIGLGLDRTSPRPPMPGSGW